MKVYLLGLMAFMAVSFSISETHANAKDVKKEASNFVSSVQRSIQKHSVGFGLGQTFLMGNFEKKGDSKIGLDFLYSYTASYSFDLLVNAHMSHHTYRDKAVWLRGYTMSIKGRSYEFDAFSPFVVGGLGFYMPEIQESDGKTSEKKWTFGFNFGGGVDLRLNNKITVGVLAQFHKPFDVKQDETQDVRGSYFKLLLTTMYQF